MGNVLCCSKRKLKVERSISDNKFPKDKNNESVEIETTNEGNKFEKLKND